MLIVEDDKSNPVLDRATYLFLLHKPATSDRVGHTEWEARVTPVLNLGDLHCFVLVYEERSFTRAANRLDTAQSQVSARIQRLERFAGMPLFTRLPHGIMPNRQGELLYEHAKRVLGRVAELETAVREPRLTPVA
jgi:hypothetical protein